MTYPQARTVECTESIHGVSVSDPYRWLEDADSDETREWVAAQNALSEAFLSDCPLRGPLKERLRELWNYARYDIPFREGGRFFFTKNDGLQNQSPLYVATGPDDPSPRLLLDPNTLSEDGTVALSGLSVSRDGRHLAYSLSTAGSDWQTWRVRDIESGEDWPDRIEWSKFSSAAWAADGSGFYYGRYDAPTEGDALQAVNKCQKLCFHRLGTPQESDEVIYERPDEPDWGFHGYVTEDGAYLVIYCWVGTDPRNRLFVQALDRPGAPIAPFLTDFDAQYSVLGNDGPIFYLQTDNGAPRGKIIAVDVQNPSQGDWRTIVPESEDTLEGSSLVGQTLFALYLHHAQTQVKTFSLNGEPIGEVALPGIGSAYGFSGRRSSTDVYYSFTSFTHPPAIFRYCLEERASTLWRRADVACDLSEFVTEQVFVTSRDGTPIPLFLTYGPEARRDGNQPVYLYGYGGFNASITPGFSVGQTLWLERGGVLAVACLRGGGEYGEAWHQAGTKLQKQNVFDDFIACAEWLISSEWTRPERLAIAGGSNGGLLVGACMTQRPELFGACLPAVGVMDMLRFNRFTIGWAWESDYGSPDNPEEFAALLAYSPYRNLKEEVRYPATLVTTSDHDDRVVPAHSYKFAARLQACQARGGPPTLIRIETDAGHGAGKPVSKSIEVLADTHAFLWRVLGG